MCILLEGVIYLREQEPEEGQRERIIKETSRRAESPSQGTIPGP